MRKILARVVFLAVFSTVLPIEAAAQNIYGSLVGNVTDTSGGAIPGASVTATQTETNLASLSMAAPVFRLRKERLPQVARLVMTAARGLSAELGSQVRKI